jgi:alpha-tubulin suppressor-like RCC1 family protein
LSASEREPTSISEYFTKIKLISCGAMHSVVVTEDEKLWVFGCNSFGQISDDLNIRALGPTCISHDVLKGKKIVNVSCGWSFTVVLTEDGDLFMNGVFDGFLVSQPKWFSNLIPNEHIVHVACGNDFLIALNSEFLVVLTQV